MRCGVYAGGFRFLESQDALTGFAGAVVAVGSIVRAVFVLKSYEEGD